MVFQKHWIMVLIFVNIFLLYVLYAFIQQWNYVSIHYRNKFSLHDTLKQRQVDGLTNGTFNTARNASIHNAGTDQDNYLQVKTEAKQERNQVLQQIAQKHPDKCTSNCGDSLTLNRRPIYNFFKSNFVLNETIFAVFKENKTLVTCDGKIEIHKKHFAILHDVVLHLQKWQPTGLTEAGKDLHTFKSHQLRTDEAEVLKPVHGLLDIHCPGKHDVTFDNKTFETVLMLKHLRTHRQETSNDELAIDNQQTLPYHYETDFTIAIEREDYANFYHIMLHMHSIFTMLMVFHQQPVNTSILIFDAHPQAEVDGMLETLYGPLIRVTKLTRNIKFKNFILSLKESKSLLSKYWINSLPHLEEFREFVYNQYLLKETHFLICRKLTITFIWRRDKIWHPRNLKGTVQRKIFNEAEIYKVVYDKYPNVCINGLLLESVPIKEQLKFIGKTDLLIGMHGAGLTHTLFLPKTSGLIELFPLNFRKTFHYYKLFEVIARRRDLQYMSWENTNSEHEMPNYFTRVDPESFITVVDKMIQKLCDNDSQNH